MYLLIYNKTISLRSYAVIYPSVLLLNYQVQTQFFLITCFFNFSKIFKNNFFKNLTSEHQSANSSRKTCLFSDAFRLTVGSQIFFTPRP